MNDTGRRRYEMLTRVRDFGTTYAASFPDTSKGGELFTALGAIIEELDVHAETQVSNASAAVQESTSKSVSRAALRADVEAINRTARAMAFATPGLDDRFRLPRSSSNQALLNSARAFASDAVELKTEFIRHELPANFLETLETHIAEFEQATVGLHQRRTARVSATNAIDSAVERGISIVRQLDAVVKNKFRAQAATLAAWASASHTERPPRTAKPQSSASPAASGGQG